MHFLLTRPGAIDKESGDLLPTAAKQLTERGLSVLREAASDKEFQDTFAEMKKARALNGQESKLLGVSTFSARAARYAEDGRQRLGVFATGLPGRPNHADVAAPPMSKAQGKEARAHMRQLLAAGRQTLEEFRGGSLGQPDD